MDMSYDRDITWMLEGHKLLKKKKKKVESTKHNKLNVLKYPNINIYPEACFFTKIYDKNLGRCGLFDMMWSLFPQIWNAMFFWAEFQMLLT